MARIIYFIIGLIPSELRKIRSRNMTDYIFILLQDELAWRIFYFAFHFFQSFKIVL